VFFGRHVELVIQRTYCESNFSKLEISPPGPQGPPASSRLAIPRVFNREME
jgi:hypothetical protein